MAISSTPEVEVTLIDLNDIDPERKRQRNAAEVSSSDDSTCATSSSDSSTKPKQRRRRRRQPKKKNKKGQNNNNAVDLSLEEQAQYLALDCEMVGVGCKGSKSAVARVTLVGWNGEIVFDEFIKQTRQVTDYRTFVSGITAEDLEQATLTLEECRNQVNTLLQGKTLVGHALKNDMKALGISHPWFMTRDTAKYEQFMQVRFNDGVLWPRKLKDLVKTRLHRDIQVEGRPHCPCEDAMGALDLYKLVRNKWEKAMAYKIEKTKEIETKSVKGSEQTPVE